MDASHGARSERLALPEWPEARSGGLRHELADVVDIYNAGLINHPQTSHKNLLFAGIVNCHDTIMIYYHATELNLQSLQFSDTSAATYD